MDILQESRNGSSSNGQGNVHNMNNLNGVSNGHGTVENNEVSEAVEGKAKKVESSRSVSDVKEPGWTFLTNHTHVLVCLSRQPDLRLRDVAAMVGITERAVQRIVADLEDAGILTREKEGRRNRYEVLADRPLRHSIEAHRTVADLLDLVNKDR
ncbi:MAG: MarR family transcriptional regulator [Armatimonadaceae bacterium]